MVGVTNAFAKALINETAALENSMLYKVQENFAADLLPNYNQKMSIYHT